METCLMRPCRSPKLDDRPTEDVDPDKKASVEPCKETRLCHWADSEWEVRIVEQIWRHAAGR